MALFGRDARLKRRGTPFDALVVGVGNPGRTYDSTRHNVGFDVIDELARRYGVTLKSCRESAVIAEVHRDDLHLLLVKPTTYMNESGRAVGPLARRFGIDRAEQIVVVHDELDLGPCVVRVKAGGGLAGHNGLRSINEHIKSQDFLRVRIGIGKPPSKEQGADHVLAKFTAKDRAAFDVAVAIAADATQTIVADGVEAAMQPPTRDCRTRRAVVELDPRRCHPDGDRRTDDPRRSRALRRRGQRTALPRVGDTPLRTREPERGVDGQATRGAVAPARE